MRRIRRRRRCPDSTRHRSCHHRVEQQVQRAAEKLAVINSLNQANLSCNAFETAYWNIANWNRTA